MDLNDRALQPSNAHVLTCWARLCWGVGEEFNLVLGVVAECKPPAIAPLNPISNKQQKSSIRGAGICYFEGDWSDKFAYGVGVIHTSKEHCGYGGCMGGRKRSVQSRLTVDNPKRLEESRLRVTGIIDTGLGT